MGWRLAKSLEVLRDEVNQRYPGRPTGSDGTIGDTAHSSRTSDHNPNSAGVVCALDLTEWVQGGVEMNDVLAEHLRASRDPRIKYIISDGRMFSSYNAMKDGYIVRRAWEWGPYSGINAHTKHVHVSVHGAYDDRRTWNFREAPSPAGPVTPTILGKKEMFLFLDRRSNKIYLTSITDTIHVGTPADVRAFEAAGIKNVGALSDHTCDRLLNAPKE